MTSITRLFPLPSQTMPLDGIALNDNLLEEANKVGHPIFYTSFITSLDGRIAVPTAADDHSNSVQLEEPATLANPRDWRIVQELYAQAEASIVSSYTLKSWLGGQVPPLLETTNPAFQDLAAWRAAHQLPPQPDIVVISRALNYPIEKLDPALLGEDQQAVFITTEMAPLAKQQQLEANGWTVALAGEQTVDGRNIRSILQAAGYRTVYSTAGSRIAYLLFSVGGFDRLYLTRATRILGGEPFASINDGRLFNTPNDFEIQTVYHDPEGPDGVGQIFETYRVDRR